LIITELFAMSVMYATVIVPLLAEFDEAPFDEEHAASAAIEVTAAHATRKRGRRLLVSLFISLLSNLSMRWQLEATVSVGFGLCDRPGEA
jgi:hypothetical protein